MPGLDNELLQEFVAECEESCEVLDGLLLVLETSGPDQAENIGAAFRAVHSIKGAAGFMEATVLEQVAHATENILSGMRDSTIDPGPAHFAALFEACDSIGSLIGSLALGESPDAGEFSELTKRLLVLADADPAKAATPAPTDASPSEAAQPAAATIEPSAPASKSAGAAPATARLVPSNQDTVRVDVALLDNLMNLVGELVVCRNQILRVPAERVDEELADGLRQLDHLTRNIQERVMKTRMRPVGGAWSRLPRMVRDLAATVNKQIKLQMVGADVELDRSMLAQIKDPLAHMIRNAVDHGLEAPDIRVAAGKPPIGHLRLSAQHVGGQVVIELQDDGRGLDPDVLRDKGIRQGLITEAEASVMTADQIQNLIFEPGFSTAASVSKLSGRGVGMDVVRSNLTQIGGTADVHSTWGRGTTFRLKNLLTLAILPALIVRCAGYAFAIPQAHLVELVDLRHREPETLGGAPVLRRNGLLLPLVFVNRELDLQRGDPDSVAEFAVVVQADDNTYGLVVDQVEETEEIVVKPLGPELESLEVFSGATVRGDGTIALILDVVNLAQSAQTGRPVAVKTVREVDARQTTALLRFDLQGVGLAAVPVDTVIRIEDVPADTLQRHGNQHYLNWNGRVLPVAPLVDIEGLGSAPVSLVVCEHNESTVAVAVSDVLDVVDEPLDISEGLGASWAIGLAIVCGKSTAILDLDRLAAA